MILSLQEINWCCGVAKMPTRYNLEYELKRGALEAIWKITCASGTVSPEEAVILSKEMREWYILLGCPQKKKKTRYRFEVRSTK